MQNQLGAVEKQFWHKLNTKISPVISYTYFSIEQNRLLQDDCEWKKRARDRGHVTGRNLDSWDFKSCTGGNHNLYSEF